MENQVITVRNLMKKFGSFVANDNLNFEVYSGEIFGFLGANGAGKTTTIRILSGLSRPTSGEVTVAGFDAYRQPEMIKKNIGYMCQKFSLYEDLTVKENIMLYGGIYGMKLALIKERVLELLERLNFQEYENRIISDFPLGLRQKLAFSVAVLHEPRIVFLDEPTGGVDPITRRQFWEMIYETAARGITVFVTTHYMDEAEYCNRIGMMFQGELIALSEPDELRRQLPGALYQLDCEPLELAESILRRMPSVLGVSVHGALLHVDIQSEESKPEIEAALAEAGVSVRRLEPALPSLEDVFIQLVEKQRGKPARAGENP